MAQRQRINVQDYYDEYGGEEDYYGELDDEAEAIKESKKMAKKAKKAAKKSKGVQEEDIDALEVMFPGVFTREQIKGTLENYKNDKDQAIAQLKFRKQELDRLGKENNKAKIKQKVQDHQAQVEAEEEKKAREPPVDRYEAKRLKQLQRNQEREITVEVVDKEALNAPYPEVHYKLNNRVVEASEEEKQNLNLVIIGHVDSGKSTLSGKILHTFGIVSNQQLRQNERKAEVNNKAGFQFAYIMDETEEEQERGVTIEVTTRHFTTPNRNFTILDAPGHRDFIANMITGAAQANCGILVVDVGPSQFERGWEGHQGTTREHAMLARSLGVTQLVVALNKMERVHYEQDRFEHIKNLVMPFLLNIGFQMKDIYFLPISAIEGENVTHKATESRLTSWYGTDSPTLIDVLDGLRLPTRSYSRPLRVTISDFMQKHTGPLIGDCVAAKVESGVIIEKRDLLLMPQNVLVGVKGITRSEETVQYALGGAIIEVGLRLPSDFDVNYLKRGNVLCDPENPIKLVHTFIARLVIYDLGTKGAVCKGEPVMIHSYSSKGPGKLQQFISVIDQATGEVIKSRPKFLRKGMFVNVQVKLFERQCLELFSNMKNIGRIVVRQEDHTIAAGTILEFLA